MHIAYCQIIIVRMNFSHGPYEYHQSVVDNARAAASQSQSGRPLAIALDTVSVLLKYVQTFT